jgi:hypothetical protein
MNKRFILISISTIIFASLVTTLVSSQVSVGVEIGDWVKYDSVWTGTPPSPYTTEIRFEIISIQGTNITFESRSTRSDGTQKNSTRNLDLEKNPSAVDLFIIPANLNANDEFHDDTIGNVKINGVKEKEYAGIKRTVVHTSFEYQDGTYSFEWDKTTGIVLRAVASLKDFSQRIEINSTNLWQPGIFGFNPTVFYLIVAAIIAVLALVLFFVIRRR